MPRLRISEDPLNDADVAMLPVVIVMAVNPPSSVPLIVTGMLGVITPVVLPAAFGNEI